VVIGCGGTDSCADAGSAATQTPAAAARTAMDVNLMWGASSYGNDRDVERGRP
jgi:hypothetical protein